jgi:hypothetical protein
MKLTKKFISGMLVTVAVGASMAGAQAIGATTTTTQNDDDTRKSPMNWDLRIDELKLIDSGDYTAWKQLMIGSGRQMIADKVTSEDFAKMAALFDAIKAENYDQAKTIAKDLKMPNGLGMGKRGGRMRGDLMNLPEIQKLSDTVKAQLKAAVDAKDGVLVRQILEQNGITPPAKGKFKDRQPKEVDQSTETTTGSFATQK